MNEHAVRPWQSELPTHLGEAAFKAKIPDKGARGIKKGKAFKYV